MTVFQNTTSRKIVKIFSFEINLFITRNTFNNNGHNLSFPEIKQFEHAGSSNFKLSLKHFHVVINVQ